MQPWKYKFGSGSRMTSPSSSPSLYESDAALPFIRNHRNSVSVENLPGDVHKLEIVSLFHTLIGEVQRFQEYTEGTARLEITFLDPDTAMKAMCMNGYYVGGVPLKVAPLTTSLTGSRSNKIDDRRNLYVLGIPFALTKNEFASLFAQYGTVSHCVILATVDNSSRRRGFIVMSSHEEAKKAMAALTRTQIKGHTIDVSWAVVQRSHGFLDGGDRSMVLDSRTRLPSPCPRLHEKHSPWFNAPNSTPSSKEIDSTSLLTCCLPTTSLLVSNLPTLLFSQAQDLHPLFFPFGQIDKLEIVHVSPLGCLSVIVQYSSTASAQEAKDSLNGQLYGSFRLEARYVRLDAWSLLDAGQNLATSQLPLIERRMTDPLLRSDYLLPGRCDDDRPLVPPSKGAMSQRELATATTSLGRYPRCDLVPDSNSTYSARKPLVRDSIYDLVNSNSAFSPFKPTHDSTSLLTWNTQPSCGRRPLPYVPTRSNTPHLETLYQTSAA